jgi:hypothetical protein
MAMDTIGITQCQQRHLAKLKRVDVMGRQIWQQWQQQQQRQTRTILPSLGNPLQRALSCAVQHQ